MKLRRCLATVASAVALAPVALLTAPTAFASTPPGSPWQPTIPLPSALVNAYGLVGDPDDHTDLRMDLSGLATRITAGSGWHRFLLTEVLPTPSPNTDVPNSPPEVHWTLALADYAAGRDALASYAHVQYLNGSAWTDLGPWAGSATRMAVSHYDIVKGPAAITIRIPVRVRIDAGAPTGAAYAVAVGSYMDATQGSFVHTSFGSQQLTVAPGTAGGGTSPTPSRRASAATGHSSPLPLVAGIAGAAIVVGGAAALAVRRRSRA